MFEKNLSQYLRKNAYLYFLIIFFAAIVAFYPGYFSKAGKEAIPGYIHFHGLSMSLWCLTLVCQAILIKFKKSRAHKYLGYFSVITVLLVLVSGLQIAHITVSRIPTGTKAFYSSFALMFNSLLVFTILFFLALKNRKSPTKHMRYIVCSTLPLFTPITDRISYFYFRPWLEILPQSNGRPLVNIVGFGISFIILIIFLFWDWSKGKSLSTMLTITGLILLYNASVLFFYRFSFWQKIAEAIMAFSIS